MLRRAQSQPFLRADYRPSPAYERQRAPRLRRSWQRPLVHARPRQVLRDRAV